jgi:hypothetical protein
MNRRSGTCPAVTNLMHQDTMNTDSPIPFKFRLMIFVTL